MPQAEANVVSQIGATRQGYGVRQLQPSPQNLGTWAVWKGGPRAWGLVRAPGLGLGRPGPWGPGPQGLGAWGRAWKQPLFRRSEKSRGRGLARGWESAETAAADVGAWREAGTGYLFTLSVTEASNTPRTPVSPLITPIRFPYRIPYITLS